VQDDSKMADLKGILEPFLNRLKKMPSIGRTSRFASEIYRFLVRFLQIPKPPDDSVFAEVYLFMMAFIATPLIGDVLVYHSFLTLSLGEICEKVIPQKFIETVHEMSEMELCRLVIAISLRNTNLSKELIEKNRFFERISF
jgi:hypothetical protein